MTETAPITGRESTAAARRRVAAADRARDWRERQRKAEAAREDENASLRAEIYAVRAERDRLQTIFDRRAKSDTVDEDIVRAVVRLGGLRRSDDGPLAIGRSEIAVRDVVAAAALMRCGGAAAGQAAYNAARGRIFQRLAILVPPPEEG